MSQYRVLRDESRTKRRSLADAIDILQRDVGFTEVDRARVHLHEFWPGVALVAVEFERDGCINMARLPSARKYCARKAGDPRPQQSDIEALAGASADNFGNVCLASGDTIRAVDVIPWKAKQPGEHSWRILHALIRVTHSESICYRRMDEDDPLPLPDVDLTWIDCSKLHEIQLPPYDILLRRMRKRFPNLAVNRQKIDRTLKVFGIENPGARPKRQPPNVALA